MAEGVRVTKRLTLVYGTNSLAIQYQLYADEGVDAWIEVIPVYGFHSKMIVHLHTRRLAAEKKKIAFLCQQKRQVCILIQMVISSRWKKNKYSGIVLIKMDLTDEMAWGAERKDS